MSPYEFIDHTADIAVRVTGVGLNEVFALAGEAMFDIITGGARINRTVDREIRIEALDQPGLLVGFLSELVVLHDAEGLVFGGFDISMDGPNSLTCRAHGEPFDPARHGDGVAVKGVSYHMLEIREATDNEPACAQVLFDI